MKTPNYIALAIVSVMLLTKYQIGLHNFLFNHKTFASQYFCTAYDNDFAAMQEFKCKGTAKGVRIFWKYFLHSSTVQV